MASPYSGRWGRVYSASKTATDYDIGDILYDDATNIVLGTTTSTNVVGICCTDKPSTDTSTDSIYISVPKDRSATFIATVSGTFTKADEGQYMDLASETAITADTHTYKPVRCVKYINATTGVFAINDPIT